MNTIKKEVLLFDMDGVLVDVSESYRLAIKKTAEDYTGTDVSFEEIQSYKEKTGFNNDWDLTEAIVKSRGESTAKQEIINKFQEYYLGKDFDGLIANEKWVLKMSLLEKLSQKYVLGIVTGRPRIEAQYALDANNASKYFSVLIAMEDVKKDKPNPEGIIKAMAALGVKETIYFGDTKSDEVAAQKAGAKFELVKNNTNEVVGKYCK
ncbi:Pyrophosphatase PpaX [uncultured archaeon]|nr:Pyrophosphatase PpaX [uncultured archaeon]